MEPGQRAGSGESGSGLPHSKAFGGGVYGEVGWQAHSVRGNGIMRQASSRFRLARENPASVGDAGAPADETSGEPRIQLRRSVRLSTWTWSFARVSACTARLDSGLQIWHVFRSGTLAAIVIERRRHREANH